MKIREGNKFFEGPLLGTVLQEFDYRSKHLNEFGIVLPLELLCRLHVQGFGIIEFGCDIWAH